MSAIDLLVDAAMRTLQHDIGEQDPEYKHLTAVLKSEFGKIMATAKRHQRDSERINDIEAGGLTIEHRHGLPAEMRWLVRYASTHLATAARLRDAIDQATENPCSGSGR